MVSVTPSRKMLGLFLYVGYCKLWQFPSRSFQIYHLQLSATIPCSMCRSRMSWNNSRV